MPSTTIANTDINTCDDMRALKAQLAVQSETIKRLQQDMQALNMKYVAAIERAAETLYEKDMVEHELEELSCRLFEQANNMVAQEKREKCALEDQLKQTQEKLAAEQNQLQELRLLQHQQPQQLQQDMIEPSPSSSSSMTRVTAYYPHSLMEAFKNFAASAPQRVPLIKLQQQFSFIKSSQEDDVEPCLRFGPHSRWSVKKMIEYLQKQPCFIEKVDPYSSTSESMQQRTAPSPAYNRPLWERWIDHPTSDAAPCCAACGEPSAELDYQFRLDASDDWSRIDRYCRDRLVAVCEFYVFIRNIHMGLYADRDIHVLYEESVRLRLQIFDARYEFCI